MYSKERYQNNQQNVGDIDKISLLLKLGMILEFSSKHTRSLTFGIGTTFMLFESRHYCTRVGVTSVHITYSTGILLSRRLFEDSSLRRDAELSRRIYVAKFINHSSKTRAGKLSIWDHDSFYEAI